MKRRTPRAGPRANVSKPSHPPAAHRHHREHPLGKRGKMASSFEFSAEEFERRRSPLERGAGRGQLLFLDAQSGIAGDMTVAALIDLGVPFAVIQGAIAALGLGALRVELGGARKGAVLCGRFAVHDDAEHERDYAEIRRLLERSKLAADVSELAQRIFRRLAEAEARVHGLEVEDVHFHEVGAADSIADIVGAAAALVHLGAEVVSSPLPLGSGQVRSQHGVIPMPAPATLECLRGVPTYPAGIEAELVTPTGAAIVGCVATRFETWPAMVPERVGWGGGGRDLPDRVNALRVVLGKAEPLAKGPAMGESLQGTHVVLEANVDDMTGELVGHVLAELMRAGALDAWAVPCTMKKGRPGIVLAVLVAAAARDRMAELMFRQTHTLGVRHLAVNRTERPRRMIDVATRFGSVPVKVAEGPYGAPELKPEFDVCVKLAEAAGVAVKEVIAEVQAALPKGFGRG